MKQINLKLASKCFASIAGVFLMTLFMSCSCLHCAKDKASSVQAQRDSVMVAAVGDSIYKILSAPKRIYAMVVDMSQDSVVNTKTGSISIKKKDQQLLHFILSDPQLYGGDITTYGLFLPSFKLTFIKGQECCVLNFDFGLKKWAIRNHTGQVIKKYDLPSDNMLRYAHELFPEYELFKELLNTKRR